MEEAIYKQMNQLPPIPMLQRCSLLGELQETDSTILENPQLPFFKFCLFIKGISFPSNRKEEKIHRSVNGLMVRILPFQGRGPGSIPG